MEHSYNTEIDWDGVNKIADMAYHQIKDFRVFDFKKANVFKD